MMLDMHSFERDKYKGWSITLDSLVIFFSIVLNSLVFTDFSMFTKTGLSISVEFLDMSLRLSGVLLLASSVILVIVDWKRKVVQHDEAIKKLFDLKMKAEQLKDISVSGRISVFLNEYRLIMDSIIPIANKRFNKLKSRHLRKLEFSKYISLNPRTPFWKLSLDFWLKSMRNND